MYVTHLPPFSDVVVPPMTVNNTKNVLNAKISYKPWPQGQEMEGLFGNVTCPKSRMVAFWAGDFVSPEYNTVVCTNVKDKFWDKILFNHPVGFLI